MEQNLNTLLTQQSEQEQAIPQGATDLLAMVADKKGKKDISLSSLSKKQIDKIMKSCDRCYTLAKNYYSETVEPKLIARTELYHADDNYYKKKFPRLSEKTLWKSRDIQTAAEWLLPGLIEAFTGSDKPISISGANVNDDEKAKAIEDIVTYQMARKNNFYQVLKYSLNEAFVNNLGIAKLMWNHEEKRERFEMALDINDMEQAMALALAATNGEIEIKSAKPLPDAPDLLKVVYDTVEVIANYPQIEFLKPYEVRFTADGNTFQNTKFVCHRKIVTGDYLKRKEKDGTYKNVDEAIRKAGDTSLSDYEQGNNNDLERMRSQVSDNDMASTYVELIEAYIDIDYNDDGITEKLIVHMVADVPLSIQENDYGFVPFYPCCIYYSPDKIFSDQSFEDLLEQQQNLKTAIVKQMVINVAQQNSGQRIVDPSIIDVNALIDGDEIVLTNDIGTGGSIQNYVYAVPTPQLSPQTMTLLEYAQNEIESQTGSTRYNQGLDSNSLNKTATGITAIMGQSEKRAKMIARDIAENFYKPLVKGIIVLDQKYMRDEEVIRIKDENVPIRKEDIDIDYDMDVNVGEGAGTKEARIQYIMVLIQQLVPLLVQYNIANKNTIYAWVKRLVEEMGLKATIGDLVDPMSEEGMQAEQQAQQQAAAQQQMLLQQQEKQMQLELLKKILPSTSLHYEDLPLKAQSAILELLGIGVENEELLAKELLESEKKKPANNPYQFSGPTPKEGPAPQANN